MATSFVTPQSLNNQVKGWASPTESVKRFDETQLNQIGTTPGATATPQGYKSPQTPGRSATLGNNGRLDFGSIQQLSGLSNDPTAALQQRQSKLNALVKSQALSDRLSKGMSNKPLSYSQLRQTSTRIPAPNYSMQGVGAQGFGGRAGIQMKASQAFDRMEAAFRSVFGQGIPINEGFRSYEGQVAAYNRMLAGGPMAAKPGTSMHGKGIAVDLGGAFQNANSAQHRWLQQYGPQFGWYWTGKAYNEPWHWEMRG